MKMTLPNESKHYDEAYFVENETYFHEEVRCVFHAGIILRVMNQLSTVKPALDVGCGPGTIIKYIRKLGKSGVNCDFSPSCNPDVVCGCDNLPFEDKQFSVVHSSDLLEHLGFDTIHHTISECQRVADYQLHHIAVDFEDNGVDTCEHHITVKPWRWWTNEFSKHGLTPTLEWGWYHDWTPSTRLVSIEGALHPALLRIILFKNH
jgi:ubiquinone/menaquinone biosynthesis C-methylase UbiE